VVNKSLLDVNVRGEMNALLIGDPGTAKSQLLQYVAAIAQVPLHFGAEALPQQD
jgi:DNA replicative helicase MCM subunit Mcm2 (Cdc46/Mcm family)